MSGQKELAKIIGVGVAYPPTAFSQAEIAELLQIQEPKGKRFFSHPHVEKRHLCLSRESFQKNAEGFESTSELLQRFKISALELAVQAVRRCLKATGSEESEIEMLCCVTSTGFIVPALSALLLAELGLKNSCQRLDVVGMGCNAGLNGLSAVTNWCAANPGKKAILICCEICSAIYCTDDSEESALVNSLFGDGCAAALISTQEAARPEPGPSTRILGFSSHLIPDSTELLRFDWDEERHRFRFVVDKRTPKNIASEVEIPLKNILNKFALKPADISHWILHSGGEAILSGVENKLNLQPQDLRHTRSVLREFGNISSGSFLYSYLRLMQEKVLKSGDYGLMMTMGPGLTIEMALLQWGSYDKD